MGGWGGGEEMHSRDAKRTKPTEAEGQWRSGQPARNRFAMGSRWLRTDTLNPIYRAGTVQSPNGTENGNSKTKKVRRKDGARIVRNRVSDL